MFINNQAFYSPIRGGLGRCLSNCTMGLFWGASASLIGCLEKYYQKQSQRAIQYNKADPVLHVTSNWLIKTLQLNLVSRGREKEDQGKLNGQECGKLTIFEEVSKLTAVIVIKYGFKLSRKLICESILFAP